LRRVYLSSRPQFALKVLVFRIEQRQVAASTIWLAVASRRSQLSEEAERMLNSWFAATLLAFEAADVMGLRMMKIAGGGAAARDEAQLMMSEKIEAAVEAWTSLMYGGTPLSMIERYREHVAVNATRLRSNFLAPVVYSSRPTGQPISSASSLSSLGQRRRSPTRHLLPDRWIAPVARRPNLSPSYEMPPTATA
jgi:hypothetical protein